MIHRPLLIISFSTLLPVLVWAQAQPPKSIQSYNPRFILLFNSAVQKELQLTSEAMKKVEAKMKELAPELSWMNRPGSNSSDKAGSAPMVLGYSFKMPEGLPPGRVPNLKNLPMPQLPDLKKLDDEILKLLEPRQRTRLQQIELQRAGLMALTRDEVMNELKLDADQKSMVKVILEEHQNRLREQMTNIYQQKGSYDRETIQLETRKLRAQTEADLRVLLTPAQQEKWQELLGPPLEVPKN
ncbi:MAG TPA: hypothetical protein PKA06_03205 [Gemmatales bacterium]|nr:hypothetical protein [Gemmatales bacterium]HMP18428.1 hypothetical protein [Gemmatales bacterium]